MNVLPLEQNANFRIITSNVLFTKDDYTRPMLLLDNYLYYKPDVIGLQEMNKLFYNTLVPGLEKNGYKIVTAQPDPDKRRESELRSLSKQYTPINHFTIAYNADRFEEVESYFLMYTSTWTHTKGLTAAVLREKATGRLIGHINTHAALVLTTYGNGLRNDVEGKMWREDNARQILEECAALKAKYGDITFFVTGDFNCNESEPMMDRLLSGGFVNTKYAATVRASMDQYSWHPVGEMPDPQIKNPIDHILVTPDVEVLVHSIETRQEVLDASDHCIVYADIRL